MSRPLQARRKLTDGEAGNDSPRLNGQVEDCWDEPEESVLSVRSELEILQGAWFSSAGRREAEFLIAGDHFTIRFADGDIYMGTLDVDGTAQPAKMTMLIVEGPGKHRGKTAVCLYEQDGETLRWCASEPGRGDRLTAFPAEDDSRYLSLLFRREERV
jgi:uncharacterized protein (TIGR03067 family)